MNATLKEMQDSLKCKTERFRIPPFQKIEGTKYSYPKNKTEWVRECKKAIEYRKRTYAALCAGRPPPPKNYYYERLLRSKQQQKRDVLRHKHRKILIKRGVIKHGDHVHVHHRDGKFALKHCEVVDVDTHKRIHAVRKNH
jgi:hypothetical protein